MSLQRFIFIVFVTIGKIMTLDGTVMGRWRAFTFVRMSSFTWYCAVMLLSAVAVWFLLMPQKLHGPILNSVDVDEVTVSAQRGGGL